MTALHQITDLIFFNLTVYADEEFIQKLISFDAETYADT